MKASRTKVEGFTIDGPSSKDLDDAIFIESTDTYYVVDVHIADVASCVNMDDANDVAARRLAFSRYLPKKVHHMLPSDFAERKLSLLPGKLRPTITFRTKLNKETLEVSAFNIFFSELISHSQLTYSGADKIICGKRRSRLRNELKLLNDLAVKLIHKQQSAGALVVYDLDKGIMTDEEGRLQRIKSNQRYMSCRIVQELMILTNANVANFMHKSRVPIPFRNHMPNLDIGGRNEFLKRIQSIDNIAYVNALRNEMKHNLGKAYYQVHAEYHIGLNLQNYAHATSPIRRYADLLLHRQLRAVLANQSLPYQQTELMEFLDYINNIENELKATTSSEYSKLDKEKAKQHLEDKEFLHMPPSMFKLIVKMALENKMLSEEFEKEFVKRINRSKSKIVICYNFLFVKFIDYNEEQRNRHLRLQRLLLEFLCKKLDAAAAIFALGVQANQITNVVYQENVTGNNDSPIFECTITAFLDGNSVSSDLCKSGRKKETKQLAMLSWIANAVCDASVTNIINDCIRNFTYKSVLDKIDSYLSSGDYMTALHNFATRARLPKPEYKVAEKKIDCHFLGKVGKGYNKHLAARDVFEQLSNKTSSVDTNK